MQYCLRIKIEFRLKGRCTLSDFNENEVLKVTKLQYFFAALSFVPLLGFLVSLILLPVSLFSKKEGSNRIAFIASIGTIIWVLIFTLYTPAAPKAVTLRNGNVIYPLSEGNMYFSAENTTAYHFKYQTAVDIENEVKLKEEAELVWLLVQPKVNSKEYTLAALSASSPKIKTGLITSKNKNFGFLLKKSGNGNWSFLDKP